MRDRTGGFVLENNYRAYGYFLARRKAVCALSKGNPPCASVCHPTVNRCIIRNRRTRILRTGYFGYIHSRNIRQIVVVHIRNIRSAAQSAAFKFCNIRRFAGFGACRNGFKPRGRSTVANARAHRRGRISAVFFKYTAVRFLHICLIPRVGQRV